MKLKVAKQVLSANDAVAAQNRARLDAAGILAVNLMASPGAGKTSLILATAERLPNAVPIGVIEGDLASRIDADLVAAHGIPVTQINTGGSCHLDAPMIQTALEQLPLEGIRLLFIENVGNLVCPAEFALGSHLSVVVASVPEGHDKPYKYPGMFARSDAVVLNKTDVLGVFDFDLAYFERGLRMVNPSAPLFVLSCRTGQGLDGWVTWLLHRLDDRAKPSIPTAS
ncbi:MAG: hydrogenase nickel incorporation protein HypB [Anaerolineae bacterium]|nr:hydrogenase nickel incorporation protein HypB [Anaerolineae bacterium]MDW8071828.1 hydrogenase nickel incorporation protein HypB [Anaerolineae bacterium]